MHRSNIVDFRAFAGNMKNLADDVSANKPKPLFKNCWLQTSAAKFLDCCFMRSFVMGRVWGVAADSKPAILLQLWLPASCPIVALGY